MKKGILILLCAVLTTLFACREGDLVYTETELGRDITSTSGGSTGNTTTQPLIPCNQAVSSDFPAETSLNGRSILNGIILTPEGTPAEAYPMLLVYNVNTISNGQPSVTFEFGPSVKSDKNGRFKFDVATRNDIQSAYVVFDGMGLLQKTNNIGVLYGCNGDNALVPNKSRNLIVSSYNATDIYIKFINENKSDSISILGLVPSVSGGAWMTGISLSSSNQVTNFYKAHTSAGVLLGHMIVNKALRGKQYTFTVLRIKNGVKTEENITILATGMETVKEIVY